MKGPGCGGSGSPISATMADPASILLFNRATERKLTMDLVKMNKLIEEAANPNTAPAALSELRTLIQDDTTALSSLAEKVSEQESSIRQLQDTNMRLFLQAGSSVPAGEEEKTDEDEYAELSVKFKKDMEDIINGNND